MNTVTDLLSHVRNLGVKLSTDGKTLHLDAPKGALTAELKEQLVRRKEALISYLSQYGRAPERIPAARFSEGSLPPLSSAQQRLWFMDRTLGKNAVFNFPLALRLEGWLDIPAVGESLDRIVARHRILSTVFSEREGQPRQWVRTGKGAGVPVVDWRRLTAADPSARTLIGRERAFNFDLRKGPLMRTLLIRLGRHEHVLLLNMHHIVTDGWSTGILVREFATFYKAAVRGVECLLPELPIQYADYAVWQQAWLDRDAYRQIRRYWERRLENPPVLEMPTDFPRPERPVYGGASVAFFLDPRLTEELRLFNKARGTTPFMTFLAALYILLQRYSGQSDLAVGTDVANRNRPELEGLIGFFVNQLVLRCNLGSGESVNALLARVREQTLADYAHQDMPFEKLVAALVKTRDRARTPVFQVKLVHQNLPIGTLALPGLRVTALAQEKPDAQFEMTLVFADTPSGGFEGTLIYATDLYKRKTVLRFTRHFENVLQAMVADGERPVHRFPVFSREEVRRQLVVWNRTHAAFDVGTTIPRLFRHRAATAREQVALVSTLDRHTGVHLGFGFLDRRSNRLAHALIQAGVGPEIPVGIFLERGPEMAVAILAVLKAGGFYVPLDRNAPSERLAMLLADAGLGILITTSGDLEHLPAFELSFIQTLCLDIEFSQFGDLPETCPNPRILLGNLAYLIYTSGSSGVPKGVAIAHRSVVNLVQWQADHYGLTPASRISQYASYSFDASVGETFMALLNGGTLVQLDRGADPRRLARTIRAQKIHVLVIVPSLLKAFDPQGFRPANGLIVVAVGEALTADLAGTWSRHAVCMNGYGPTEYTVYSHIWPVRREALTSTNVPIGRPIHNTATYLLDAQLNPVPLGAVGGLYLGGIGTARGYHLRPELNAQRFVPNPFPVMARVWEGGSLRPGDWCETKRVFEDDRKHIAYSRRGEISSGGELSREEILEKVGRLDAGLMAATTRFLDSYPREGMAFRAFARYLLEGANNALASCPIEPAILRRILDMDDFRGLLGVDFGFGNGETLTELSRLGADMAGLDLNPFFVANARSRGLTAHMVKIDAAWHEFHRSSKIDESSRDFAISTLLLDRLEKPTRFLRNFFRVLKPGGSFAIQTLLPVVPVDDGEVDEPIVYTRLEDRLTPGRSVDGDKQALLRILVALGATEIAIFHFPYLIATGDGIQEYRAWSFCGRKAETSENPVHASPSRLYRTGDLGRYLEDGRIEFIGRRDFQVKIRGYRVELDEIAAVLEGHPEVKQAAVLHDHDGRVNRIFAYIVPVHGRIMIGEVRDWLQTKLPDYMIPNSLTLLDRLPLTPSGKLDRKALAAREPIPPDPEKPFAPPRSREERVLAELWAEVVGKAEVGIHDNFFEIGGDSILSLQIAAKAAQRGIHFHPNKVFEHQTLAELAAHGLRKDGGQAEQGPVTGDLPMTPIQRWFFEKPGPEPHHYNQSVLLRTEALSESVLYRTLRCLTNHHDALRLRFRKNDGGWEASIADPDRQPVILDVEDLTDISESNRALRLEAYAKRQQTMLNLAEGPLVRAVYFAYSEPGKDSRSRGEGRLLLVIHHLAVDAVSWRILLEDLVRAYHMLSKNLTPELPPKTTSYLAWAQSLEELAGSGKLDKEARFWKGQFESEAVQGAWELGMTRNPINSPSRETQDSVAVSLSPGETRAFLREAGRQGEKGPQSLLLTALSRVFAERGGPLRLQVDLETHGRDSGLDDLDVARTVGWFTNLYPVALHLGDGTDTDSPDWRAALQSVKKRLKTFAPHGSSFGVLRYLRGLAVPPSPILFNYLGRIDRALPEDAGFAPANEPTGPAVSPLGIMRYLLEINGLVVEGRLRLQWTFSNAVLKRGEVSASIERFREALNSLVARLESGNPSKPSPADYPLANIGQRELDGLTASLGRGRIEDLYPLSPMQQGMLYHCLSEPRSGVYLNQLSCRIRGPLNLSAFRGAWSAALAKHSVLRTEFHWEGLEHPLQAVVTSATLPWTMVDWQQASLAEPDLDGLMRSDRAVGMRLNRAPLMHITFFVLGPQSFAFVWSHHHLILDGWSVANVLKDVFLFYETLQSGANRPEPGEPGRPLFREYIAWLNNRDRAKAESYWRETLAGFSRPTPPRFPGLMRRPLPEGAPLRQRDLHFAPSESEAIRQFARKSRLTINTLLQAAWTLLLHRVSGATDLVFGNTVSGRPASLPGIEAMVGLFINTLPVRVRVDPSRRLIPWLEELQADSGKRSEFAETPLADVQRWADLPKGIPLFESNVVFENYPVDRVLKTGGAGLSITGVRSIEKSNIPLTLIGSAGETVSLRLTYDPGRFDDDAMIQALERLRTIMTAFSRSRLVGEVFRPDAETRRKILKTAFRTAARYPSSKSIPEIFAQVTKRAPDKTALIPADPGATRENGSAILTYAALEREADRWARRFAEMGVTPEDRICVCLDRSPALIAIMLATLKAGAAYVPLEPSFPAERISLILSDAAPAAVVTDQKHMERLPSQDLNFLLVFMTDEAMERESGTIPASPGMTAFPSQAAYIMFTSGSTGTPKGVAVPHRAVIRLLFSQDFVRLEGGRTLCHLAPPAFDAATFEVWGALLHANTCVLYPEMPITAETLAEVLWAHRVDLLWLTASLFNMVVEENPAALAPVRQLLVGGEALSADHVRRFRELLPDIRIVNGYGPTENTTFSCCDPLDEPMSPYQRSIPIGQAIRNTQSFILDDGLEPVPEGMPGELWLGGDGLARGYHNRPGLTAAMFAPSPFPDGGPGRRLYRTGDLGYFLRDGRIDFLGRLDFQVKLRGYRIELGEIESVLRGHPQVKETAVIVHEEPGGSRRLIAFFQQAAPVASSAPTGEATSEPGIASQLRQFLRTRLPEQMVPAVFIPIASLPLTASGKVDRLKLPRDPEQVEDNPYQAPRTETERAIAGIWSELLGVARVSVSDSFFDIGGHSLSLTQAVSRIQHHFQIKLTLRFVFQNPNLEDLAAHVDKLVGFLGETRGAQPLREDEEELAF